MHRHSLKALKRVVLDHCHGPHPDLALLARELGRLVRSQRPGLGRLARQVDASGRLARVPLRTPRRLQLQMAMLVWPSDHAESLYDHTARWGLQLALHGPLEVETWRRDALTGLQAPHKRHWLGPGDALWFDAGELPWTRCRNLSRREPALSLHVFGQAPTTPLAWLPAVPLPAGGRHLAGGLLHG